MKGRLNFTQSRPDIRSERDFERMEENFFHRCLRVLPTVLVRPRVLRSSLKAQKNEFRPYDYGAHGTITK